MMGLPSVFGYGASDSVLVNMWTEERRKEFESRRIVSAAIREVDENKYGHHVVDFLSRKFHREIFEKLLLDGGINTEDNVLRDLADRTCVGWSRGSSCTLWSKDNQPVESPEFQSFVGPKVLNLSGIGAEVERKCRLHGPLYAMPWCAYSERLGERRMGITVHTPETYDLIGDPNNPNDYLGVIVFEPIWVQERFTRGLIKRQRATIWTRQTWWQYVEEGRGNWKPLGPKEGNPNPYNMIPGARIVDTAQADCLWPYADGARWAEAAIRTAAWETYKDFLAPANVKTLVGEFDDTFPAGQMLRHGGVIALGKAENVQVADWQVDLDAFDKAMIQTRKTRAGVSANLSADEFTQTIVAESGTAKRLRNADRDSDMVKRQGPIKRCMEELYGVAWWMAYVESARQGAAPIYGLDGLPPGAPPWRGFDPVQGGRDFTMTIDPADMSYAETEQERQQRLNYNIAEGYQDRVEEMQRINPNLSKEEAYSLVITRKASEAMLNNKAAVKMEALKVAAQSKGQAMPSASAVIAVTGGAARTANIDGTAPDGDGK